MRLLTLDEAKKVSGGQSGNDWDPNLPVPPNFTDFSESVAGGAIVGAYMGGVYGAAAGAGTSGAWYIIQNAGKNIYNYYF